MASVTSPPSPYLQQPLREGVGQRHCLFAARLSTGRLATVFLDYGSVSSWTATSLVPANAAYDSQLPANLRGIGQGGPSVTHDTVVSFRFEGDVNWLTISCGIVPDGTFPGQIVLGRTVFHALGIECLLADQIKLNNVASEPILSPLQDPTAYPTTGQDSLVSDTTVVELDRPGQLLRLLQAEFPDLFDPRKVIGSISKAKPHLLHHIELTNYKPIKHAPRRYSPSQQTAIDQFVSSGLKDNVISTTKSLFASAAVLIAKTPTVWRFCVDFRDLNARTVKHAYPLPNIDDQIQKAAGHRFYVRIDLVDGFWQIYMDPNSGYLTAFVVPNGHYEFCVMPFGLTNAPATFQMIMDEVLEPLRSITANMIDDIITWGDSLDELYANTRRIFRRLQDYGLRLNVKKCAWFVPSVKFLGHILDQNGLRMDPDKVKALLERPEPTTLTELRSFLSAANYFRQYIDHFSGLAAPLYDLTGLPGKSTPIRLIET